MIKFIVVFTILFIIFIEIYVKHILFRYDSSNNLIISITGIKDYLMNPFYSKILWNRELICTNYPFMLFIGLLLYSLF